MQTIWIEAFLAVVDRRGFAAAAAHLYRSQGRVSSYIGALEQELGSQLFDRNQRPARLTAEGEAFLPYARSLLEVLETGRNATIAVQGLKRGDVAIGTFPSAGAEYVPLVLARFRHDYPEIDVKLIERQTRALDIAFDSGETAMMIRPSTPQTFCRTPFQYQLLWREAICVVVASDHPLANRQIVMATDVAGEPLVIGGRSAEDAEITTLLSKVGVRPHIKFISNQPQSIVAMARQRLAIGVVNTLAVRSVKLDGVVTIPLEGSVAREVGLYWGAAALTSHAAQALMRTILDTAPPDGVLDLRGDATVRAGRPLTSSEQPEMP